MAVLASFSLWVPNISTHTQHTYTERRRLAGEYTDRQTDRWVVVERMARDLDTSQSTASIDIDGALCSASAGFWTAVEQANWIDHLHDVHRNQSSNGYVM